MDIKDQKSQQYKSQNSIHIGLVQYKHDFLNDLLQSFKKKYEKILTQKIWQLEDDYINSQWPTIIKSIRVAYVEEIVFGYAKLNLKFLKDIVSIKMENLQSLFLCGNKISNIESFTFLYAPKLKWISLGENNISNITKGITKMNFQKIESFSVEDNFVQAADLGRIKTSSNKGCIVQFQESSLGEWSLCSIHDKSIYAKCQNLNKSSYQSFAYEYQWKLRGPYDNIFKKVEIYQEKCLNAILRKVNSNQMLPHPRNQINIQQANHNR